MRKIVFVVALVVAGCSNEKDQLRAVVREGRALLRHPEPGDPKWDSKRGQFLSDSELVAPTTTGSK